MSRTIYIASRGSALALVQANFILGECRKYFPEIQFDLKIIKTTGDKLQTLSLANPNQQVSKGLFTKELEVALLNGEADLAVHSLKDLPTELPPGLKLAAASAREDVRDVLIYVSKEADGLRGLPVGAKLADFRNGATIATSSTRRAAQLLALRPDLKTVPIRGNVGTRLHKLRERTDADGLVLAMAGLKRLGYAIADNGTLQGRDVPEGLLAVALSTDEMLPCVGQAALGIETRANDPEVDRISARLNDPGTFDCVIAERAFLAGMGGGCLSPVAALATIPDGKLHLRAVSFRDERVRRAEGSSERAKAAELGARIASQLS